jgi:hypothetical protein
MCRKALIIPQTLDMQDENELQEDCTGAATTSGIACLNR